MVCSLILIVQVGRLGRPWKAQRLPQDTKLVRKRSSELGFLPQAKDVIHAQEAVEGTVLDISVQVRDDMGEAGESSTARGDFGRLWLEEGIRVILPWRGWPHFLCGRPTREFTTLVMWHPHSRDMFLSKSLHCTQSGDWDVSVFVPSFLRL